jgi:hypothetical protein
MGDRLKALQERSRQIYKEERTKGVYELKGDDADILMDMYNKLFSGLL